MPTATAPTTNGRGLSKFQPGFEPEIISLKSVKGTPSYSQYNGDETLLILTDGRRWYAPITVGQQIERMMIQPGEEFKVSKTETRDASNRRITTIQIEAVVPIEPAETPTRATAGFDQASTKSRTQPNGNTVHHSAPASAIAAPAALMNGRGETSADQLQRCYRSAIDIVANAVLYAAAQHLVIAPDFEDIRCLAATIAINECGARR